jgi:CheY-like chemotaxis protein
MPKIEPIRRVLLIDDDPGVHLIVTPLLVKDGFSVISAMSGEQGLQLALKERPDVIVLDVILPGIKGRDLCMKIKAYDVLKDIPVVFLTSKNSPDDMKAEMAAGGAAHLTKPVNSAKFADVIKVISHLKR